MIGRRGRAVVGLALLCALVFSAFAASSAQAIKGTTAFTCKPEPNAGEKTKGWLAGNEHCTGKEVEGKEVKFVHEKIEQDKATIFHGTNAKTTSNTLGAEPAILASTIGKEPTEISCAKVFAHGELTNRLNVTTKEHFIQGAKITILYTECKFIKPAVCVVKGGKIEATGVRATTEGQGDNIKFEPPEGSKLFVTIEAEKCFGIAKFPVEGTVKGQVEGATLTFSEAGTTAEKTLTFNKAAAGLGGKITLSQADETQEGGKTGNAITATTVET